MPSAFYWERVFETRNQTWCEIINMYTLQFAGALISVHNYINCCIKGFVEINEWSWEALRRPKNICDPCWVWNFQQNNSVWMQDQRRWTFWLSLSVCSFSANNRIHMIKSKQHEGGANTPPTSVLHSAGSYRHPLLPKARPLKEDQTQMDTGASNPLLQQHWAGKQELVRIIWDTFRQQPCGSLITAEKVSEKKCVESKLWDRRADGSLSLLHKMASH